MGDRRRFSTGSSPTGVVLPSLTGGWSNDPEFDAVIGGGGDGTAGASDWNTDTVGWSDGFVGNIDRSPLSLDIISLSVAPPSLTISSVVVATGSGCSCWVVMVTVDDAVDDNTVVAITSDAVSCGGDGDVTTVELLAMLVAITAAANTAQQREHTVIQIVSASHVSQ